MRRYTGILFNQAGLLQASTLVTVVASGTPIPAQLFDDAGNALSNPVVTNAQGQFSFRVRSGVYDFLDVSNNALQIAVQIFDFSNPAEWIGVWNFPASGFTFGGPLGSLNVYSKQSDMLSMDCGLNVGGAQNQGTPGLTVSGVAGGLSDLLDIYLIRGDIAPVVKVDSFGVVWFGTGGANAPDTKLYRISANTLQTDGSFTVGHGFSHLGTLFGAYGAVPIIQPSITGSIDPGTQQALYQMAQALQSLGFITFANVIFTIQGAAHMVVTAIASTVLQQYTASSAVILTGSTGSAIITGTGALATVGSAKPTITAIGTGHLG